MDIISKEDVRAEFDRFADRVDELQDKARELSVYANTGVVPVDEDRYNEVSAHVEGYAFGSAGAAHSIVKGMDDKVVLPFRLGTGEAGYDQDTGQQTSQALEDQALNIETTLAGWTDDAGLTFKGVWLKGPEGLSNAMQFQYEFAVALRKVMVAHLGLVLMARAGVIDILIQGRKDLDGSGGDGAARQKGIQETLTDTLKDIAVDTLKGSSWAEAASTAAEGMIEIAVIELLSSDGGSHANIVLKDMDENFNILRGNLNKRGEKVLEALDELSGALGDKRELLLPPEVG